MKQPMQLVADEYATVTYRVMAPVGQTPEDAMRPDYWQHVASKLRPGHEIKVIAEDMSWRAHLFVKAVGKAEAVVALIHLAELDGEPIEDDDDADTYIKWRSPTLRYGVFRKSDNECLQDKFQTKEEAQIWTVNRANSMAA